MMLLEFLAVGTWGFWVLLCVAAIAMSEMLDTDKPGFAGFVALATLGALAFLGNFNPFPWIKQNPSDAGLYVLAYFALGTTWSVVKWYFWLTRCKRKLMELKAENPNRSMSDLLVYKVRSADRPRSFPPKVGDYKSRIIGWMILWPASAIWTLINDPVRVVFEEIYERISGMMQGISNRIFKDIDPSN